MNNNTALRLDGLEPDNLLAFMALLGLLRALEEARPDWHPRASWTVDDPPIRPTLFITDKAQEDAVAEAIAEGVNTLAKYHDFDGRPDLKFSPDEASEKLHEISKADRKTSKANRYTADLWSALISDAAISRDGNKVEPTPFCLLFGQGHQHFLDRLEKVPQEKKPPKRGSGRKSIEISEADCLREALFSPWERPDATFSFRWDPQEYVCYALRAQDPTDPKTKDTTQHGANRLAAVGLPVLTVVPQRRGGKIHLGALGGKRHHGDFTFNWPIWRNPMSLTAIRAMLSLGHSRLTDPETQETLGIVQCRQARRISFGKFMNFTRGQALTDNK